MADASLPLNMIEMYKFTGGGFVKRKTVAIISILVIIAFVLTIIAPLFQ